MLACSPTCIGRMALSSPTTRATSATVKDGSGTYVIHQHHAPASISITHQHLSASSMSIHRHPSSISNHHHHHSAFIATIHPSIGIHRYPTASVSIHRYSSIFIDIHQHPSASIIIHRQKGRSGQRRSYRVLGRRAAGVILGCVCSSAFFSAQQERV